MPDSRRVTVAFFADVNGTTLCILKQCAPTSASSSACVCARIGMRAEVCALSVLLILCVLRKALYIK